MCRKYFKRLLLHKWYVFILCFKQGLVWRGIIHDYDKFYPCNFKAFAECAFGEIAKTISKKDSRWIPEDRKLLMPILNHVHRWDHHWQSWMMFGDEGDGQLVDMSREAIIEMICDWEAARRAHKSAKTTLQWFREHGKLFISDNTKLLIEEILKGNICE